MSCLWLERGVTPGSERLHLPVFTACCLSHSRAAELLGRTSLPGPTPGFMSPFTVTNCKPPPRFWCKERSSSCWKMLRAQELSFPSSNRQALNLSKAACFVLMALQLRQDFCSLCPQRAKQAVPPAPVQSQPLSACRSADLT